jgi:hypothetical protein
MSEVQTEAYCSHMQLSLGERREKSQHYLDKYPEQIPIFIESYTKGLEILQFKLLLKKNYTVALFIRNLKKAPSGNAEAIIYLYANKRILKPTDTFEEVYKKCKSDDGFLYLKISEIPALGNF